MRALLQRVSQAQVLVDGRVVGRIGSGFAILLGVTHADGTAEADWLAKGDDVRFMNDVSMRLQQD